jgi:uncharacterized membrane protein YhaH (DUF805 family)
MPFELDEEQRRRAARFDFWLFASVWLTITAVAVIAVLVNRQ